MAKRLQSTIRLKGGRQQERQPQGRAAPAATSCRGRAHGSGRCEHKLGCGALDVVCILKKPSPSERPDSITLAIKAGLPAQNSLCPGTFCPRSFDLVFCAVHPSGALRTSLHVQFVATVASAIFRCSSRIAGHEFLSPMRYMAIDSCLGHGTPFTLHPPTSRRYISRP
jgi:hypothetical protein